MDKEKESKVKQGLQEMYNKYTEVKQGNDLYFYFRLTGKSDSKEHLYCTITGSQHTQSFLIASNNNNTSYTCFVSELLEVVHKVDVLYNLDIKYNTILEKVWGELMHWKKENDKTISLYDNYKQQVTSLLEFKRIDVLFIEYFINTQETGITALFPSIVTPNGYIQCYSKIGQHSEAHTDLLHCKHLELNKYKDLLKELLSLGYNLKVLNRN